MAIRLACQARHGICDGILLVFLHLPDTFEKHSVWNGQADGTNDRRVRFDERFND